uniref:SLC13 family permease n=1 Tax=Angelakisella sp. TaxID=1935177 RepID=UPI003FEF2BF7
MANAKETRSVKNNIGLALFILILVAMFFIPTSETLTAAGRNSLGLLLATIVCMLTGGLPIGVLCMLVIPLMYICGCVETPAAALAGFQNQSAFFMLASFGLTCAVTRVPLSRRLMRGIITKAGRNVNTVLLAIMLCCGLLSSIVSNIAACSAFIPLVLDFLSIYENEDERKRTGRCMLIALPTASMIGGMITPAGGAVNVIAITYLENLAGVNVTFLDWVAIFGPIAIVAFIAAYFIIRAVFKPAELTQDAIH